MDNGSQFASVELRKYQSKKGIRAQYSPPYWPRANGQVERVNRGIKAAVQRALNEGQEWKEGLIEYLKMYRAIPQATTGRAPAELLLRRRMRGKLPLAEDVLE